MSKASFLKFLHENISHNGTEWTSHGCTFHLLIVLPLEHKAGTGQAAGTGLANLSFMMLMTG